MTDSELVLTYPMTENRKTGNVPTVAVGTPEARRASCDGCPLRPKVEGGDGRCYARGASGRVEMGLNNGHKAEAQGRRVSYLRGRNGYVAALEARALSARIVRFGASGDPAIWPMALWAVLRAEAVARELVPIGYTHQWRKPEAAHLRGQLMASCDTEQDVQDALAAGWFPALIVPIDHAGRAFDLSAIGARGVVCPAQQPGSTVTCNTCRLCDGRVRGRVVVCFRDHSAASRARHLAKQRAAKNKAAREG